jgi:hypothetical protein
MAVRPATLHPIAAALLALVAAGPARGGPTQPPTGQFAGFRVRSMTAPYTLLNNQILRILCFNPSNRQVTVGTETFDGIADPDRDPVGLSTTVLNPTGLGATGSGSPGLFITRVLVAHPKDVIDCSARVTDFATGAVIYEVPLRSAPKKKKR